VITISTNKGLIKVDSWEDVIGRAGFTDNLDPAEHELQAIIGRYIFGDKVRCGLSNCHTPHVYGYLVSTKTGRETNIGKDCGKIYFGIEFTQAAKQFDIDLAAQENRDLLWSFKFQIDELEDKVESIREGDMGANWVQKRCDALRNPAKVPIEVTRQMGELVKQKSGLLTIVREATEQEAENLEQQRMRKLDRPVYVTDFEAQLKGIEALYEENDLRVLLILGVEDKLKGFKRLAIDDLSNAQLSYWKKWATSVDLLLESAIRAVEYGRELLKEENLSPLLRLNGLEKNNGKARVKAFLDSLR
jgi:hypothetical protein